MTKHGSFKKVVRRHARGNRSALHRSAHRPRRPRGAAVPRARRRSPDRPSPGSLRHRRGRRDEGQPAQRPRVPHRPAATAIRGSRVCSLPLARGPASKAMPRSCGSWSGRTTRRSASRSTMRCRSSTGRRSSSPGSSTGGPLPDGSEKIGMMGDLLGRLHALAPDDAVSRPGGAGGDDPSRAGSPRQDLLAALSFLDAVDTKVATAHRERFEQLRDQVRSADDGHGLPEALLHGNLLHNPDHALLTDQGPVAINWKSAGRGPRLADFAYLMWGTVAECGQHRRGRERVPSTRRVDRRRTRPARSGDVRPAAVPGLLRLPAFRRQWLPAQRQRGMVGLHQPRAHQRNCSRDPDRVPPIAAPPASRDRVVPEVGCDARPAAYAIV